MMLPPLALGLLIGLGLAMSTRMRDALVEGLGRRSLALGLAGAAGVALIHALWLGLATLVAVDSADDLGSLVRPLGVVGAGLLLAVAADVTLRAALLGSTGGSPRALPDQPVKTFLQMAVIAAIDLRALAVLLGWLALAPSTSAAARASPVVVGLVAAVAGWWVFLAELGTTGRSGGRLRRAANLVGAGLLVVVAATTLLG